MNKRGLFLTDGNDQSTSRANYLIRSKARTKRVDDSSSNPQMGQLNRIFSNWPDVIVSIHIVIEEHLSHMLSNYRFESISLVFSSRTQQNDFDKFSGIFSCNFGLNDPRFLCNKCKKRSLNYG